MDIAQQTKISQIALSLLCGGDRSALINDLLQTMTATELINDLSPWLQSTAGLIINNQLSNFIPRYDIGLIRGQFNQRLSAIAKSSPDAMLAALNEEQ